MIRTSQCNYFIDFDSEKNRDKFIKHSGLVKYKKYQWGPFIAVKLTDKQKEKIEKQGIKLRSNENMEY